MLAGLAKCTDLCGKRMMKRLVSYENLLSCITRDESHHVATLDWKAFLHLSPILRLRRREARAALRKYLSGLQGAKWEVDTVRFPIGSQIDEQALNSITGDIAGALDAIATKAMTPKEICKALKITNQERLRWTKDGRLKTSGVVSFRRANIVSISTYSAHAIHELMKDHSVIEGWRQKDLDSRKS